MPGLLRTRRGSVTIMTAIMALPMVAFSGIAVDAARMWLVQARLQTAVDAGVLAATRQGGSDAAQRDGIALFWSNFLPTSASTGSGYLGATAAVPVVTLPSASTVMMTSTATLPTAIMGVLGFTTMTVSASATALSQATGLELSLVLDNTGSMAGWPIQSVISSASDLVNILYGSGSQDVQPNLWVSVVPFTAEVNIGNTHTNWLAKGSYKASAWSSAGWKGCTMARVQTGDDFTDAPPVGTGGVPFTPYLWPSTLGKYKVGSMPITGDNDWSASNITEQNQNSLQNNGVGPNLGCATLPILGEVASRSTVLNTISQMVAVFRGGTFINLGLQAGWWTLSPLWRGLWGSNTLPLNYNTQFMRKVIVLMTDGNNTWFDWPGGAPGSGPSPWVNDGDTDYSAYGRLNQNLMQIDNNSQGSATTVLNNRMSQMCTIIKQHGITIYTILFNHDGSISSDTQDLFQSCASDPTYYFLTPSDDALQAAFSQIGTQLANLRLTQ